MLCLNNHIPTGHIFWARVFTIVDPEAYFDKSEKILQPFFGKKT